MFFDGLYSWRTIFSWSKPRSSALSPNGGKSSPLTPVRSSASLSTGKSHRRGSASNVHGVSEELNNKLWSLFDAIQNYTDPKGRKLSTIFMRLPSKLVTLLQTFLNCWKSEKISFSRIILITMKLSESRLICRKFVLGFKSVTMNR